MTAAGSSCGTRVVSMRTDSFSKERQCETPGELRGRVGAAVGTLRYSATGLALLLGAGTVAGLDHRVRILAAGMLGLATTAAIAMTGRIVRPTAPISEQSVP